MTGLASNFFQPGMNLMRRLPLRAKLLLMSASLLVPLILLLAGTFRQISADVDIARSERAGLGVVRSLTGLMVQLQTMRLQTAQVDHLDGNLATDLQLTQSQMLRALSAVDQAMAVAPDPAVGRLWVALRARGPESRHVFDGPVWAHSSPVFVTVANKPIASKKDAAFFVAWIDRLIDSMGRRNRYAKPEDRQRVEALFRRAQARFQEIATGDR